MTDSQDKADKYGLRAVIDQKKLQTNAALDNIVDQMLSEHMWKDSISEAVRQGRTYCEVECDADNYSADGIDIIWWKDSDDDEYIVVEEVFEKIKSKIRSSLADSSISLDDAYVVGGNWFWVISW